MRRSKLWLALRNEQVVRGRKFGPHRLIVEEDIDAVVTALGYVMEKFGHHDPGSSWHAAIIDGLDGKLLGQLVRLAKKGSVPFISILSLFHTP